MWLNAIFTLSLMVTLCGIQTVRWYLEKGQRSNTKSLHWPKEQLYFCLCVWWVWQIHCKEESKQWWTWSPLKRVLTVMFTNKLLLKIFILLYLHGCTPWVFVCTTSACRDLYRSGEGVASLELELKKVSELSGMSTWNLIWVFCKNSKYSEPLTPKPTMKWF